MDLTAAEREIPRTPEFLSHSCTDQAAINQITARPFPIPPIDQPPSQIEHLLRETHRHSHAGHIFIQPVICYPYHLTPHGRPLFDAWWLSEKVPLVLQIPRHGFSAYSHSLHDPPYCHSFINAGINYTSLTFNIIYFLSIFS